MCRIMEELQEESRTEGQRDTIRMMQNAGRTLQQIAEFMNRPLSEIETLMKTPATTH